jgi:hypothetical protein
MEARLPMRVIADISAPNRPMSGEAPTGVALPNFVAIEVNIAKLKVETAAGTTDNPAINGAI